MSYSQLIQQRRDYVCCSWFFSCSATEMNHSAMLVAPMQERKLTMSSCCFASPGCATLALLGHVLALLQYPSAPSVHRKRVAIRTASDCAYCSHHLCWLHRSSVPAVDEARQCATLLQHACCAVSRDCQTAPPDAAAACITLAGDKRVVTARSRSCKLCTDAQAVQAAAPQQRHNLVQARSACFMPSFRPATHSLVLFQMHDHH